MAEAIAAAFEPAGRKPSSTSTARSTATSATAPPSASGAASPDAASPSSRCCRSTDLDALAPAGEDLKRADYLVYTDVEARK